MELIKQGLGKKCELQLLMRGSRDGFEADKFHELCDGKGPTLAVVESANGKAFGGYTSISWSSHDSKYFPD